MSFFIIPDEALKHFVIPYLFISDLIQFSNSVKVNMVLHNKLKTLLYHSLLPGSKKKTVNLEMVSWLLLNEIYIERIAFYRGINEILCLIKNNAHNILARTKYVRFKTLGNANTNILQVLSHCTSDLQSLYISDHCKITNMNWFKLFTKNDWNLYNLDISNCSLIEDATLISVVTKFSRLRLLNLNNCISLLSFKAIFQHLHCVQLEQLYLDGLQISDNDLNTILMKCPQLKVLSLSECFNLTNQSVFKLIDFKNLKSIYLERCYQISLCYQKHWKDLNLLKEKMYSPFKLPPNNMYNIL